VSSLPKRQRNLLKTRDLPKNREILNTNSVYLNTGEISPKQGICPKTGRFQTPSLPKHQRNLPKTGDLPKNREILNTKST